MRTVPGFLAMLLAIVGTAQAGEPAARTLPPIRHVFILILENESFETSFAQRSAALPFLPHELPERGALLREYYARRACKPRQLPRADQRSGPQ